ncbi:hypothetical protein ACHAPE_010597 [Trichoderma viride]
MDPEAGEQQVPDLRAVAAAFRTIGDQVDISSRYTEFPPSYNEARLYANVDARLASFEDNMNASINRILEVLRADIAASRSEFNADIAASRSEFKADIAASRSEFNAKMAEFNAKMAESRSEFNAKMAESRSEFHADIQALNTRVSSLGRNDFTRTFNSTINQDSSELAPLYNVETGEAIANFPQTIYAINQLSVNEVDDFLRQLDLLPIGDLVSRRRRLILAYGVVLPIV